MSLRSLWYLVNLVILTLWYSGRVIVGGLLRLDGFDRLYERAVRRWALGLLRAAGVSVRVIGMERVPRDRPVIFASNHQSWFDILTLGAHLPRGVRFVSKKELAKVPVMGSAMRHAGHIFIDRQNRQQAFVAYEEAAGVIRGGMSAVVFPEGTRSRTGELLPFKKGPFVLAIASRVPLVPVYCAGTFGILPKGRLRVRPRPVALYVGEPISTEGLTYDDRDALRQRTREAIERLRIEAGEGGAIASAAS